MIASIQRRPLVAALAAAAVLLLVVIGVETGFGSRLRPAIPQEASKKAPAPEAKLLPPMVAMVPEQAYPETTARPLFTPTRRPAPPDNSPSRPAFNPGQFVLQGVIVVGEARTALLKEKTSGKIHRVESGKELNGITVERIEPTEVTLAMGDQREKVALVVQRPEGAGAARGATPAEAQQGPFGAVTAAPPPPGAPVDPAGVPAVPGARAVPVPGNPVARGAAGSVGAQPSTQPMTPEELLARRRARRNQPTQ